jgi:hypothetical protein
MTIKSFGADIVNPEGVGKNIDFFWGMESIML